MCVKQIHKTPRLVKFKGLSANMVKRDIAINDKVCIISGQCHFRHIGGVDRVDREPISFKYLPNILLLRVVFTGGGGYHRMLTIHNFLKHSRALSMEPQTKSPVDCFLAIRAPYYVPILFFFTAENQNSSLKTGLNFFFAICFTSVPPFFIELS